MNHKTMIGIPMVLWTGFAAAGASAQHEHEGDIVVGRTGAGQLAVEFDAKPPFALPPVSGLLEGWLADHPGFMSLGKDEPKEDFFGLAAGANVVFELLSVDPAFQVWTPGFSAVVNDPGETWKIGGAEFDAHATWHINSADPSFDPLRGVWEATFRLIDAGATGYAASEVITISFVAVPEPATAALLVIAAGGAWLHRTSKPGHERKRKRSCGGVPDIR